MNGPRDIDVFIDELVLVGFPPEHRARIGSAMQREFVRLLGERPLGLVSDGSIVQLDGGAVAVERGATPESIGHAVARGVHDRLASANGSHPARDSIDLRRHP